MRLVTIEEYTSLKSIIKNEMIELANHENKNSYFAQVAINNCYVRNLSDGSQLFQLYSPDFISIIEHDYMNALIETPEYFGTNNAKDVIQALYIQAQKHNWVWNRERYSDYLSNEIFCLLLRKKEKEFDNDILRVDLFRLLKESKDKIGCFDFVGGIFHALKHFSVGEQSASIYPNQNVALYDIEQLIWPIANAFFKAKRQKGNRPNTFESEVIYLNKMMTLEFYKEDCRNVSFVNSIIPKSL